MPSKSRVVLDQRKTEEIIQAYGHAVTPETLALFNGVLPERIIQTPSFDTGAALARVEIDPQHLTDDMTVSPIEGTAPADYTKSRDSKPGGMNTVQTKHEESIVTTLAPPDPITGLDAGTFLSPDIPPADLGAATKRAPQVAPKPEPKNEAKK